MDRPVHQVKTPLDILGEMTPQLTCFFAQRSWIQAADVEDLLQELTLKVIAKGDQCNRAMAGWIWRVARNLCHDLGRSRKRDCRSRVSVDDIPLPAPPSADPDHLDYPELWAACRPHLDWFDSEVLALLMAGFRPEAIAKLLDITLKAVYKRAERAKKRARQWYDEQSADR